MIKLLRGADIGHTTSLHVLAQRAVSPVKLEQKAQVPHFILSYLSTLNM